MPIDPTGTIVRHDGDLGTYHTNDVQISADGSRIYAADDDGNLRIYQADSGQLLQTIHVGTQLGAIDLSPDGSFLMAVEMTPVERHDHPNDYPTYTVSVYRIDLGTGSVTSFDYETTDFDYVFHDIAVLANGDVLLSSEIFPGFSGGTSLKLLDLGTGDYSVVPGGVQQNTVLSPSADGSIVLGGEGNISDAPLLVYRTGSGITAIHDGYDDNVSGFNTGIQAFSAESGFAAQYLPGHGLYIYDSQLNYRIDLTDTYPQWLDTVTAVAFDSSGSFLFVLDSATDSIIQLSTSNWSIVQTIAVNADITTSDDLQSGNTLIVGTGLRYFTVLSGDQLIQVDNPSVSATLSGTAGNDSITGTALYDDIIGGAGNDSIHGSGGNDRLTGGSGDDSLYGDADDDSLNGGAGNDRLSGGSGRDTADYGDSASGVTVDLAVTGQQNTGGAGADTLSSVENLIGSAYADRLAGNASDNILVGGAGDDQLDGRGGTDTASYSTATGGVSIDLANTAAQNTGGAGRDTLISFENVVGSAYNDSITGTSSNNGLFGGAGTDLLAGAGGDDLLDGGAGGDDMRGGVGNDRYVVDHASDAVTELVGEGSDHVIASVNYALGADVENLTLAGAAENGTGNALDNEILGNDLNNRLSGDDGDDLLSGGYGNDELNGGAGEDVMYGGRGGDHYYVGSAGDRVVEYADQGFDTISSAVSMSLGANLENLTLLGADDLAGRGNSLANRIVGNSGDNHLYGGEGRDDLSGGDGNDVLDGGAGYDFIFGGNGNDILIVDAYDDIWEDDGAGFDTVRTASDFQLANNFEQLELTGTRNASGFGNASDNVLIGNGGSNYLYGYDGDDRIFGEIGNDTLVGAAGYDRMYGGVGDDLYVVSDSTDYAYESAGEGYDTVESAISLTLRNNVERLVLTGSNGLYGKGNALANIINGNAASNKLYGLDGDDRLFGDAGDDRLDGGLGYDRMYGGLGDDRYVVGDSTDFAYELAGEGYDRVESSIDHVLRANIEMLTLTGAASLVGKGNVLDNVIIGNASANRLYGLDGDDRIDGGGGNDRLDGGAGADRMYGGSGNDVYYANSASDLAIESAGAGNDTVYASVDYGLRVNVERLVLTGGGDLNGRGNDADNGLTGNAGANKLYGYEGADVLDGRDGADLLNGGAGEDKLIGGNGDDRLYGEDGIDVLLGGAGADRLEGGAGHDRLFGGGGADEFVFRDGDFGGLTTSTADQIKDFSQADGDTIRLSIVDANTTLAGDQAFGFIGSDAFHGSAGELRYEQINGDTYVQGDVDGDGTADFWIRVDGVHDLTSGDFIF